MTTFKVGPIAVEVLDGVVPFTGVPTSQWHGDRLDRTGKGVLANLSASDGLRLQVVLVTWPGGEEVSLRQSILLAGPADYQRLEDAGELGPKIVGDRYVARIRAMKYKPGGRAGLDAVAWGQLDAWLGTDSQTALEVFGATRVGSYGDLYPQATRFKAEPAVEVPISKPDALFAVYALTRVLPIMAAHGKPSVEGPHA
jgi:hypothetical protein